MSTFDNPNENVAPESVSPWPTATRHGLLGGLVLVVISLVIHLTGAVDYSDPQSSSSWVSNLATWTVMIAAMVLAIRQHRDHELGGFITFGRSFYTGFIAALMIAIVSAIWSYVFFAFIEPGLMDTLLEVSRDQMIEQQGMSASDADNAMEMMSFMFSPAAFAVFGGGGALVVGVIFSLIIAPFLKRER
ncbi:DUF4199 domain-containing protein [Phaeodactylibacter luteus]|uniref:DUF4199 domain-containing protein n=1 Tax=Phaeodactylibacter luteus TaxID=1564516 RepID=A0A5C6RLI6_9BACT|nr:DUF4199 domain-containing protein [Phaeodactylibacter luteus]TXB62825.1 DUF4199 domain-containing protein [Phaeodactylibacter luteus]